MRPHRRPNTTAHAFRVALMRAHTPVHRQNLDMPPPLKWTKSTLPDGLLGAFSDGGGWQATAALATIRNRSGSWAFPLVNVGNNFEHPVALRYIRDRGGAHGIDLCQRRRTRREGFTEPRYGPLASAGKRPFADGDSARDVGWCLN